MIRMNTRWRHRCVGAGIGILATALPCLGGVGSAIGQSRLPNALLAPNGTQPQQSADDHAEFTPDGIDLGKSFIARPKLDLSGMYDDNVFKLSRNAKGDTAAAAEAEIAIQSTSDAHPYGLYLRGRGDLYQRYHSENAVQYTFGVWGQSEISDHMKASATAGFERLLEPRGESETLREGSGAVLYNRSRFNAELATAGMPIYGYQSISYDEYIYGLSGGVNNKDRNRFELLSRTRAGYELSDSTLAFVELSLNQRQYTRQSFDGYDHTSQGYRILSGLHYELSDITFLDISVGWLSQSYRDNRFATASGPAAAVSFKWRPIDPILLSIGFERRIDETDDVATSGLLTNAAEMRLDYDIAANISAGARLGYSTAEFEKIATSIPNPVDTSYQYGLDLRYLFNSHLYGYVGWQGIDRKSTRAGQAYQDNQMTLGVSTQW